jgi:hypothetical protein
MENGGLINGKTRNSTCTMSEILAPQEDASLFALTDAASETPKAET